MDAKVMETCENTKYNPIFFADRAVRWFVIVRGSIGWVRCRLSKAMAEWMMNGGGWCVMERLYAPVVITFDC